MKLLNTESIDAEAIYNESTIEYLSDIFESFEEGIHSLLGVELKNGEKILCLYNNEDENVLYLAIHLVDYVTESGSLSYACYPYQHIADEVSELILDEAPAIMFAPNQRFIKLYFEYWDAFSNSIVKKLMSDGSIDLVPSTTTLS